MAKAYESKWVQEIVEHQLEDGIYFPLSDSWRKIEDRKRDCTERITKLLRKLEG